MELRDRFSEFIRALPLAHRVVIVAAAAGLLMGGLMFARWVTAPSWTVLYSGMDDGTIAEAIDELESQGVPYQLEGGGSTILVPRERLYTTRARLAQAGLSGRPTPKGYEILDSQGLSVSDFKQRVDYQRALEGELSKTLGAMEPVKAATVHLVMPDKQLFVEREEQLPVTASVLLQTRRDLSVDEIDTVTFLVSSAVEGLEPDEVTVADADGTVLHAPGDTSGPAGITNRQLRHTREFESALAADLSSLLARVTNDDRAAVVVRASLNYDERTIEQETFGPGDGVMRSEATENETFAGTDGGVAPGGLVGVDGGPVNVTQGETDYDREQASREFAVDRLLERTDAAPGGIEKLSVAIVMDDGSLTGVDVPPVAEVEELVSAALGLDPARGDTLAVSTVPFPTLDEAEEAGTGLTGFLTDLLPRAIAGLVLLLVSVALFLMSRGRRRTVADQPMWGRVELGAGGEPEMVEVGSLEGATPEANVTQDLHELVQRQPEEIASLLRGWLADRR
ncbi:MAG TPA: flagellar basal-body MS-ring/collar protein FliF [Egibacteraceae bacterium]|nr:flagellar basal-body MS-ring/collar protein FliF [Egibacteraceae bacterium]